MVKKQYDLFVSYTHAQRELVEALAGKLRTRQVRVWYDGWEMKPGDYLRDKIIKGIGSARLLLVVVSPDALTSNWVRFELNCGFTAEIESLGLKVVPALAAEMTPNMLPLDLRGKYCLDLRSGDAVARTVK